MLPCINCKAHKYSAGQLSARNPGTELHGRGPVLIRGNEGKRFPQKCRGRKQEGYLRDRLSRCQQLRAESIKRSFRARVPAGPVAVPFIIPSQDAPYMAEMRDLGFFLWRQATKVVAMDRPLPRRLFMISVTVTDGENETTTREAEGIGFDYKTTEAESDFCAALSE